MLFVIALSLSSLVILAGLYLLSRSKKENLSNVYQFSSYAAIVLGFLLFAGTIVGGGMRMMHCKKGHHAQSMCSPMHHGGAMSMCGSSCGMKGHGMMGHGMKGMCGMKGGHHGMKGHAGMGAGHHGMHTGMHKMCSEKCENNENCDCPHCPHKGGKEIHKEVIIEEIESEE